ncbi:MAG TPA: amidohydrolase, partial [Thermoanaerobaculia bacterium]
MRSRRIAAVLLFLAAPLLHADAPGVYAITGGTVHPVSGPAISNGTVIVREGLIEAVGANASVPADATIIDAAGAHVYPGLIDAQTSMGF